MHLALKAVIALARCSRGTPRVANRLLRRMRDFAQVAGKSSIDEMTVAAGLKQLNIDGLGLETYDRQILRSIIENYSVNGCDAHATACRASGRLVMRVFGGIRLQSGHDFVNCPRA